MSNKLALEATYANKTRELSAEVGSSFLFCRVVFKFNIVWLS